MLMLHDFVVSRTPNKDGSKPPMGPMKILFLLWLRVFLEGASGMFVNSHHSLCKEVGKSWTGNLGM